MCYILQYYQPTNKHTCFISFFLFDDSHEATTTTHHEAATHHEANETLRTWFTDLKNEIIETIGNGDDILFIKEHIRKETVQFDNFMGKHVGNFSSVYTKNLKSILYKNVIRAQGTPRIPYSPIQGASPAMGEVGHF